MIEAFEKKLEHIEVGMRQGTMPSQETIHSLFVDMKNLLLYLDSRVHLLEKKQSGYMEPRGN